jgi:NAD(P)H-hydrate epimerase
MKVVTAEQMRALDRRAIEEFGMPGAVLMENAGRAVVEVIAQEYGPLSGKRIAVFCGAGNNGGDGAVIARYLHLTGANPFLYMVGDPTSLKNDARMHFEVAQRLGLAYATAADVPPERYALEGIDLIVDALLGTGVKDAPRGAYQEAIRRINAAACPVVAVDLPSGLDADTGAMPGEVVHAAHTVTFAYPKLGLLTFPGAERIGTLHIADIGFDWQRLADDIACRLLTKEELRPYVKKRAADSNKGDYGHVAVIAGSQGMAGAPALVARGAQRAGAGLVTVLAAACVQPMIAAKLDEQMTLALPDADGAVAAAAFDAIAHFAERATVLCIGPGLTTAPAAVALVQRLLAEIQKPIVLDADGLNALAQRPECLVGRPDDLRAPLILTPHPGEAARLLGTSIAAVQSDRIAAVRELARRFRAVALLKGRYTLISDPEGRVAINTTGNPGMATGGAGDTLTGILGALVAQDFATGKASQDIPTFRAATHSPADLVALGVYIHGSAGDLAAAREGEVGLVAGDLITCIPAAIQRLEGNE